MCKSVPPKAVSAIKIRSGVAGDVFAPNPQVNVELVGMGGARLKVRATDDCFAVRAVQEIEAAVREGGMHLIDPHPGPSPLQGEGGTQPKYIFIPWTRFEEELFSGHV